MHRKRLLNTPVEAINNGELLPETVIFLCEEFCYTEATLTQGVWWAFSRNFFFSSLQVESAIFSACFVRVTIMNELDQLKLVQKHLNLAVDHLIQAGTDLNVYVESKKEKTYDDANLLSDSIPNSLYSLNSHQKALAKIIENLTS